MLRRCDLAPDADVCVPPWCSASRPKRHDALSGGTRVERAERQRQAALSRRKRPLHCRSRAMAPRASRSRTTRQARPPGHVCGNLPNGELPPLYRAADVFVTCSTSETYGLTVLEALACGTPAVLPHCGVFDELWIGRVPDAWIYDEGKPSSLLAALQAAGSSAAKAQLKANPIKASWQDATAGFSSSTRRRSSQPPRRHALASLTSIVDQLVRAALVAFLSWWLLRAYTTGASRSLCRLWTRSKRNDLSRSIMLHVCCERKGGGHGWCNGTKL